MELQLHQDCYTHIDPSCSLHKATDQILQYCCNGENLHKPVLGQGGRGATYNREMLSGDSHVICEDRNPENGHPLIPGFSNHHTVSSVSGLA